MDGLLKQETLSRWIIERPHIWEEKLLSDGELGKLAAERGLGFAAHGDDIKRLWQLGLLKADLVTSDIPLEIDGLVLIDESTIATGWNGETKSLRYTYADNRIIHKWKNGIIGAINKLPEYPKQISLLFHPFRYYVLNQLEEKLKVRVNSTLLLRSPKVYTDWLKRVTSALKKWSSQEDFAEKIFYWNEVVTIAIGTEPFTFNKLYGFYTIPYDVEDKDLNSMVEAHYQEYKPILENIGLERIENFIDEIGRQANTFEPNKELYAMLRLTKKKYRMEKIKGKLGGLMYLMSLAESLRRAAEFVFEVELPEEDEIGFGLRSQSFKRHIYGANRIFDGDRTIRNSFVRRFGLDYSIRLRWYVEGETELGALESVLGRYKQIQLLNLRGQIAEKNFLAFRDSLRDDMRAQIYSWISLDGDRSDYVSPVKKAAENEEFFGCFFVSNPDFEFGNFTKDELVEILWNIAEEKGATSDDHERLLLETKDANSGKSLFSKAKKAIPLLQQADKGKIWGQALMTYAVENEHITSVNGEKKIRPIIEAIDSALYDIDTNYAAGFAERKVDPNTGRIVEREKPDKNKSEEN